MFSPPFTLLHPYNILEYDEMFAQIESVDTHDQAKPNKPEAEEQLRLIRRVGCVAVACQRHAFEAYNPMTQQAASVYDMLLHGQVRLIEGQDIGYASAENFESRLVQMAFDADKSLPPEYRQLFW